MTFEQGREDRRFTAPELDFVVDSFGIRQGESGGIDALIRNVFHVQSLVVPVVKFAAILSDSPPRGIPIPPGVTGIL
jgi:hypothetical protein